MELSIIIVNWNSKDYLAKCIESILANTAELQYEIIVIDSGSFDGCGDLLKVNYPNVRFFQSNENLGFARANNLAFEQSHGDFVLFLNPDTELLGTAINVSLDFMRPRPEVGVVGCRLLNSDRTNQITSIRVFPTLLNQLFESNALRKLFPRSSIWGVSPLLDGVNSPVRVDAVSGAYMLMRRKAFAEVGGFTTDYFMYSEDLDLCLKLYRAGYRNYHLGMAVVLHHGGGSSGRAQTSKFSSVMIFESRWRYFWRTRSFGYAIAYRTLVFLASVVRLVFSAGAWAVVSVFGDSERWERALRKWWYLFRWSLGMENWVRNY